MQNASVRPSTDPSLPAVALQPAPVPAPARSRPALSELQAARRTHAARLAACQADTAFVRRLLERARDEAEIRSLGTHPQSHLGEGSKLHEVLRLRGWSPAKLGEVEVQLTEEELRVTGYCEDRPHRAVEVIASLSRVGRVTVRLFGEQGTAGLGESSWRMLGLRS